MSLEPSAENASAASSEEHTAPPREPSRGSLVVLFLTVFIDLLGFGMVLPLLPNYARQFQSDESGLMIGLLMSSFSAMQFICAPLWGRLSDRIGRRPVLMVGLLGSVIFYALFGVATVWQSLWLLFVARIGAGIAGATIPTAQAYIADCTTPQTRAKGMALIGAAFGLGFTFGPLFGYFAVVNEQDSPGPGPGYAAAILSAAALALAWFYLPESLRGERQEATARTWWDWSAWRAAFSAPGMGALMLTLFICVFAFANFESTLAMLLKGKIREETISSPFQSSYGDVMLTFAYIGLSLLIAQGLIVRRLSGRISEVTLASCGAVIEMLGFLGIVAAIQWQSRPCLFAGLTGVVMGFALITPSLNSLISRWSDPTQQGRILGVAQSVNALARILGPVTGAVLLQRNFSFPYWTAFALMLGGAALISWAGRRGSDYADGA